MIKNFEEFLEEKFKPNHNNTDKKIFGLTFNFSKLDKKEKWVHILKTQEVCKNYEDIKKTSLKIKTIQLDYLNELIEEEGNN